MKSRIVQTTKVHKPLYYTQAVRVDNTIYVAGQVALDENGQLVGKGDFVAQIDQVYANLKSILEDAGAGMQHVVKSTTYVTDIRYRMELREARARWFGDFLPPDTLVEVSGLAEPDFLVEIDAIAVIPSEDETRREGQHG